MLLYQILASTILEKLQENHAQRINLKYQL